MIQEPTRSRTCEAKIKSPSTLRRNAERKQKFLESKHNYSEDLEEDKPMTEENEKGLEISANNPTMAERDQEKGGTEVTSCQATQFEENKAGERGGGEIKNRLWLREGRRRHRAEPTRKHSSQEHAGAHISRSRWLEHQEKFSEESVTQFVKRLGIEEYATEYKVYFEKNGFAKEKKFIEKVVALFGCEWIAGVDFGARL